MTKVYSYLRCSGQSQLDGDSFPRQREAIKSYCKTHQLQVVHEYRDEGVSGSIETMDRPQWQAMMLAILANGVRTILVDELSRLSRTLMIQEATLKSLAKANIVLISVKEGANLQSDDDENQVAMRQMHGVWAQLEKAKLVRKLREARQRMRQREGRCEGRKPYGSFPGEKETLDLIKSLRATGATYAAIAEELNRRGLHIRSGRVWKPENVQQILFQRRIPSASV